ncbi:hypothetical protein [Campylobacter sp. 19-13652]|uniref:hypothetical protein n=1 Tax=Campylobacter sp. 19-13652 TaxID=2840180 RepID=UPI001C74FAF8|nr:hypothetical protein [Campylobacter sp. 19-13652]BCX80034.1 hypothetical protein LBC_14960 [Campylobacter sp. 19-13652]
MIAFAPLNPESFNPKAKNDSFCAIKGEKRYLLAFAISAWTDFYKFIHSCPIKAVAFYAFLGFGKKGALC